MEDYHRLLAYLLLVEDGCYCFSQHQVIRFTEELLLKEGGGELDKLTEKIDNLTAWLAYRDAHRKLNSSAD